MPRYLGSLSPPELLELLPPTDLGYSVKTVPALEQAQQGQTRPSSSTGPKPDNPTAILLQTCNRFQGGLLGARGHPSDPVPAGQCYPVSTPIRATNPNQGQMRAVSAPSSLLANMATGARTVPFARERQTRQTDRCTASDVRMAASAAAKTLGLVTLPRPLDLAGRSYHIPSHPSSCSAEDRAAPALSLRSCAGKLSAQAYHSSTLSTFLRTSFSTRQLLGRVATSMVSPTPKIGPRPYMPEASSTPSGPGGKGIVAFDVVLATHLQNYVHYHCKSSAK